MTDPTADLTGTFRFFNLPPELRDAIYDEVWLTTPPLRKDATENDGTTNSLRLVVSHSGMAITRERAIQALPPWVLINKTFLGEAMLHLYRHCQWFAGSPGTNLTTPFLLSNGQRTERMLKYVRAHLKRARTEEWRSEPQGMSNTWIGFEDLPAWPSGLSLLKKLENGLHSENGEKTLEITFGVVLALCEETNMAVNLAALEETGFELDKLVVNVRGIDEEKHRDQADQLHPLLRDEVARLGCVFIGESSWLRASIKQTTGEKKVRQYWHSEVTHSETEMLD